jgi:hypothetical protein
MEQGGGMTEQALDALRPIADVIQDEGSRLRRSLKGSNANEDQVREHLRNCFKACQTALAMIDPPVSSQFVQAVQPAREAAVVLTSTATTTLPPRHVRKAK